MKTEEKLIPINGFKYGSLNCGLKEDGDHDLALIVADEPCQAAAAFTLNLVVAEPVKVSREQMGNGKIQALVVNAKNANACTGDDGLKAVNRQLDEISSLYRVAREDIFVASTGVIGQPFPIDEVSQGTQDLKDKLKPDLTSFDGCAKAILTTDTTTKTASTQIQIAGETVSLSGMAKGSGMIHPNMGTMLGFIFTDANIESYLLQKALKDAVDDSFNMITVDGDTSTNDCALVMASGKAENPLIETDDEHYRTFAAALREICQALAYKIVADGEGATKIIEFKVSGLKKDKEARQILTTIATSLLVKTAIFGKDPNWGRILAAAGRAGVPFNPDDANLFMGKDDKMQLLQNGQPKENDLDALAGIMEAKEQFIHFSAGEGRGEAKGWGTDLSYQYVRINAEYTT